MKEPGLAAQPSISGLTSKDSRLRVASYTTGSAWRYPASMTSIVCPIYYRNFPLDPHHGRASSQGLLIPPIHRNVVLNSNLSQETPSQVYSKVDAPIALQLHVKVSVKAQEDNSGYLNRSFHCMMAS